MIESEASVKGRVVAEMLSHFTNDLKIGKNKERRAAQADDRAAMDSTGNV